MRIRSAAGAVRRSREALAASRQVRAFCRAYPAEVRVCWDLDNTLVDSGVLIRNGMALDEAIVEAYPVANMLDFYAAVRESLPHAEHFILTARRRSMREHTVNWCARYGMDTRATGLCLVPQAKSKPRIWRQLARDARLVIVDDLSLNHESEVPDLYDRLIADARDRAVSYVGLDEISQIAADPAAIPRIAQSIALAVSQ